MKLAIVQVKTILGQPQENWQHIEGMLEQAIGEQVDTILLPETWDVGFLPKTIYELAQPEEESESLQRMQEFCRKHRVNMVGGSIAIKEGDQAFNRCYIMDRQGEVVAHYSKIHLFSPGSETEYITKGNEVVCFKLDEVPCAVQICYDLRFPELARKQALAGAEILFIPAQWPHPRSAHWQTLNRARAIENQLYVASANGCGAIEHIQSCGHSSLYDPWGSELIPATEEEGVWISEIDRKAVGEARRKIPVFQDRNPELY